MLNFSLQADLEVDCLLRVLQGSQEDVPDSLEERNDFFSFGNQFLKSKSIGVLNLSLPNDLEVARLLHVLQGSQEDVPDSLEECNDFFLSWESVL